MNLFAASPGRLFNSPLMTILDRIRRIQTGHYVGEGHEPIYFHSSYCRVHDAQIPGLRWKREGWVSTPSGNVPIQAALDRNGQTLGRICREEWISTYGDKRIDKLAVPVTAAAVGVTPYIRALPLCMQLDEPAPV